jgi:hypothetical protein
MDYQTKAATQSMGVVTQLLAIVVAMLMMAGVDISAEVANIPAQVASLVDGGTLLGLQVAALYGRLRANKRITGIFKAE